MDSALILKSLLRALFLLTLQILVLNNILPSGAFFDYANIIIYPLLIILMPIEIEGPALMVIGFIYGMLLDFFTDSIGVHASACVFLAFVRPFVLSVVEPREGYNVNQSPLRQTFGFPWFFTYSAFMLLLHLFFYFSVEAFTFVFIIEILLKTIVSFVVSILFLQLYCIVFNPNNQ